MQSLIIKIVKSVLIALIENALLILDCAAQQGNSISQTTFQNNLPSQNQNQNLYINDSPNEQNTIKSAGNESPKHSFVQPIKKDNSKSEILTRDPSPFQPEKADTEHQVSLYTINYYLASELIPNKNF